MDLQTLDLYPRNVRLDSSLHSTIRRIMECMYEQDVCMIFFASTTGSPLGLTSAALAALCRPSAEHAFAARITWSIHDAGFGFPSK